MQTTDNKALVRLYTESIENTGDISGIREFISEDYTEIFEGDRYPIGIRGAVDHVLGVRKVFPDLVIRIEQQVAEGDLVVSVYTATGTFTEEWFGMKPTGKPMVFRGVNVDRIQNGRITEHGGAVNMFEPLLRAGVIEKKS